MNISDDESLMEQARAELTCTGYRYSGPIRYRRMNATMPCSLSHSAGGSPSESPKNSYPPPGSTIMAGFLLDSISNAPDGRKTSRDG